MKSLCFGSPSAQPALQPGRILYHVTGSCKAPIIIYLAYVFNESPRYDSIKHANDAIFGSFFFINQKKNFTFKILPLQNQ